MRCAARVLTVVSLIVASPLAAQSSGPTTRAWLGLGLAGGAGSGMDGALGLMARVSVQREPHHLSLRAILMSDFSGFPDGGGGEVGELALMYSRTVVWSFGHASVGSGVSLVGDGPATSTSYTFGLPLSAEFGVAGAYAGIGIQAFGNLNRNTSFGGLALMIHLGRLP